MMISPRGLALRGPATGVYRAYPASLTCSIAAQLCKDHRLGAR